jgi:hypothetical protein
LVHIIKALLVLHPVGASRVVYLEPQKLFLPASPDVLTPCGDSSIARRRGVEERERATTRMVNNRFRPYPT